MNIRLLQIAVGVALCALSAPLSMGMVAPYATAEEALILSIFRDDLGESLERHRFAQIEYASDVSWYDFDAADYMERVLSGELHYELDEVKREPYKVHPRTYETCMPWYRPRTPDEKREMELDKLDVLIEKQSRELLHLRRMRQKVSDDDEIVRLKAAYKQNVKRYEYMCVPRNMRIIEGDMPEEFMPWDRAEGGKVSVVIRHAEGEVQLSDEEAEEVRVFMDANVSEWLRREYHVISGRIDQPIYFGRMTVRKENGFSRTYVLALAWLVWEDCYLPMDRAYSDNRLNKIIFRYIKNVSKLPVNRSLPRETRRDKSAASTAQ